MIQGNRRRFLAQAAGLAAGGCLAASGLARAGAARWTMKLSGSSINFSRLSIEQACERIAGLGFEAIDIWSAYVGCPHLDDALNRLGPDGLKALLARNKLALNAFSVYIGGFAKYAELLGKVGGGVAITGSAGPCDPKDLTVRMKAFLESLKPQLDLAERSSSTLAIENHGNALLDSVDSLKAFSDLNRNPRVGLALAPFHIGARKESVPAAIEAAGRNLLFFYAWQYDSSMSEKQLPGVGPADCAPWLTALARVNYRGYVNPFLHSEPPPDRAFAALARSRDYLRECYRKTIPV
jgi:sugar phosphate isomerase/epimerase